MLTNEMSHRIENDRVLVLERTFDAPRELVFQMFKDPEHLIHWWGPNGWDLPVCNMDFKPGGMWHFCMKCVDKNMGEFYGMESWGKAIYKEIIEPELIMYTDYFSDAKGEINKEMPASEVTLEFLDLDGKTKLVNRSEYVSSEKLQSVMEMGMLQRIAETWNRLDNHLNKIK